MAVHWTDFPEHIEKFGELFSILETLDRDWNGDRIHSGCWDNESDRSAYTVEGLGGTYEFTPRSDRIPGWEELTTYAERRYAAPLSLYLLRLIRGTVSETLNISLNEVNEMTIRDVVNVLTKPAPEPEPPPLVGDGSLEAEFLMLSGAQVSRAFNIDEGSITRAVKQGKLVTNGKDGHDRRINALSVVRWQLSKSSRKPQTESDEHVEQLIRKAGLNS